MNVNDKVLAAFEAEYQEHLESIRTLLAEMGQQAVLAHDPRLDEAFRLAHTIKGGARVCNLRPAENLGHQLETIFSLVRNGDIVFERGTAAVVNQVLDAIEDWMASLFREGAATEPRGVLDAVDRFLAGCTTPSTDARPDELAQRLREAFVAEYEGYVTQLRATFRQWRAEMSKPDVAETREAFRLAHSLKGAAHIAGFPRIAEAAQTLEPLLAQLRDETLALSEELCTTFGQALDCIENEARVEHLGSAQATSDSVLPTDDAPSRETEPVTPLEGHVAGAEGGSVPCVPLELVRVTAESLDRLLLSSGQLVGDSQRFAQCGKGLLRLTESCEQLERQRETVRRSAMSGLRKLGTLQEFGRVVRYFDELDRQVRVLGRSLRHLTRQQEQATWRLQARSGEVHRLARDARMVPIDSVLQGLRKMVRDLAADQDKELDFRIHGFQQRADRLVLQALKDPLMHILRNAVVHGIEVPAERLEQGKPRNGTVQLSIDVVGNRLRVLVEDDGRGIDLCRMTNAAIGAGLTTREEAARQSAEDLARWAFEPGLSTTPEVSDLAGRGMGLSVVRQSVQRLKGEVRLVPRPVAGTCLEILVPRSVATHRLLHVAVENHSVAIPVADVERLVRIPTANLQMVEGRPVVWHQKMPVSLVSLSAALGIAESSASADTKFVHAVVVRSQRQLIAIRVDAVIEEQESLIQELTGPAASAKAFVGCVLNDRNLPTLVVNTSELATKKAAPGATKLPAGVAAPKENSHIPRVLIVDDSFTTRTLEKSILEAQGYDVRIAVDGVEAMSLLRSESVDLVICDIEMPRMDGFQFLAEVKKDPTLSRLPVILVTSRDKREDQERGLNLGADAYILKQRFDHRELLAVIQQIL